MALARWQATIVDEAGNVLPGAQVTVRRETAGAPLAVLYADRDGLVPLGNPFPAGGDGFAFFHTAGGACRITAMLGSSTRTWRYVGIGTTSEFDAGGIPALVQEVNAGYALAFQSGTSAPPSAGAIRFNNANLGLATQAYVSVENLAGSSIEQRLLELYSPARTIKDTFTIADPATARQASFQIGNAVPNGAPASYITLTVGAHAGATSFTAGERVNFQPNRAGADGADGTVLNTREKLSANRTYYVRSDGNDSNTGLVDSAGGAFLTAQRAANVAYGTLDLNGFNVDIQIRDGTFGRVVVMAPQVGIGNITLKGNAGTPANVILTATAIGEPAGVVEVRNFAVLFVQDMALNTVTSGSCLQARDGGVIYFQGIRFGSAAHYHLHAASNSFIKALGNYVINGGAQVHARPGSLSEIRFDPITVTLTGTPAFSTAFVQAYLGGLGTFGGVTWSGAATGARFHIFANSTVTASGGLNDLPGSGPGVVAEGGVYSGLVDYANDAQVRSAAAGRFGMTVDKIESASAFVGMSLGTPIPFDWDAGINRFVSLNANLALGNPTNNQVGTWRTIWVIGNDATPRTLTFSGNLVGNTAPIVVTSTSRILLFIFALDPTFAWVAPPSAPF